MRVSRQSLLPKRIGELAQIASIGAAITCARLNFLANSCGSTWKWIWKLVFSASSMTESCLTTSSSAPLMRSS